MRIGVLGGSFDPIHVGHLILAEQARSEFKLDKVVFMPAKLPPHKLDKSLTHVDERFEMTRIAIHDHDDFMISDLELRREGTSYTVDTIYQLKALFPEAAIFFIAGADSIFQLETWMTFKELLQMVTFLGAVRPGHSKDEFTKKVSELNEKYHADVRAIEFPMIDISSTIIREKLYTGQSVRYLLHEDVLTYIKERGLYEDKGRA